MKIVEFLRDNWSFISTGILAVLSLVIMIIKRRPKKYDEFVQCVGEVISSVPFFIIEAEQTGDPEMDGQDKKQLVLGWLFTKLENHLKRELTLNEEQYAFKTFSHYIEKVLVCPTKKGGIGREQDE